MDKNRSSIKSEDNIKPKSAEDELVEPNKVESNNEPVSLIEAKEERSYGLRKRDPNINLSENELARRNILQYPNDKYKGYAMLMTDNRNFVINRPI